MNVIFKQAGTKRVFKIKIFLIKFTKQVLLFSLLFILKSCITQFVPEINEDKELLVVEGLITNQLETYKIKVTKSLPLGLKSEAIPVRGCIVNILDNLGNIFKLREVGAGLYVTDSTAFKGEIGRFYTLQINNKNNNKLTYESYPMEMKPVPPIDSLYYEKIGVNEKYEFYKGVDACQIYLNAFDPTNNCKYYRWDYEETWVFRLLWPVDNMKCWISDNSNTIDIKNTSSIAQSRINRYPINYISNATDRLRSKYSILVKQYSLNEKEFAYWEDLKNLNVQVGGLSDIIPSSIPSNLMCIENPGEKVLGYFSVSAKSTKRIFIEDSFSGIIDEYADCPSDTIPTDNPFILSGYNISVWALLIHWGTFTEAPYTILTERKGCADCTERGTTKRPDFWIGE